MCKYGFPLHALAKRLTNPQIKQFNGWNPDSNSYDLAIVPFRWHQVVSRKKAVQVNLVNETKYPKQGESEDTKGSPIPSIAIFSASLVEELRI